MPMPKQRVSLFVWAVLLGVLLAGNTGCVSHWEQTFEPSTPMVYPPTERAVLRQVPWERVAGALAEIDAERASSDIHPDEWSPERRAAQKAKLVEALQLSEDPERVTILGRSDFNTTAQVRLYDGSLSAFARSIGADYALWSSAYIGTAQTIEREAITRTGYTWRRHRRRDGHADFDYLPYNETVYVPIVIERDQFAWVVFFVRVGS